MTFCESLPESVVYRGREYRLNTAFDVVLCAIRVLDDVELTPGERRDIALDYLVRGIHPHCDGLLEAVLAVLELLPDRKKSNGPKALDLYIDTPYIYAAFRQAYGIDLFEERGQLHWLKFHALLSSVPQSTRLSDIIRIRSEDIPPPSAHNGKQRAAMMRAKELYRLPVSESERRSSFNNAFMGLISAFEERGEI